MRRIVILIITLSLFLAFTGCSSETKDNSAKKVEKVEVEEKESNTESQEDTKEINADTSKSNDLKASLALLPGIAESADKGAYVDLVKVIDEVYTEGSIVIEVNPIKRAQEILINGQADFYLPKIKTQYTDISALPYKILEKKIGQIAFVLYSNVNKKLTKKELDDALAKGGDFPFKLESSPSLKDSFKYPYTVSNSVEESLRKLDSGRIDGYIWAQEEADAYIKNNKLKSINRSLFYNFDDVLAIVNSEKTDKINKILTDCISELENSGKLKTLYEKIHMPYDDWQPSNMGW